MSKSPTLKQYQDAVWDFLIEHSDITDRGALFVKFHTSGRDNFEKRVRARAIHNYHRDDSRLGLTTREKEELHKTKSKAHQVSKETRRIKWKATAEERKATFDRLRAMQERTFLLSKYPPRLRPLINRLIDIYATARIKVLQYKQVVLCRLGKSTATLKTRSTDSLAGTTQTTAPLGRRKGDAHDS